MSAPTPEPRAHLDVEQSRRRAKELLRAARAGEPDALARLNRGRPRLADAQHAIATSRAPGAGPTWSATTSATSRSTTATQRRSTGPGSVRSWCSACRCRARSRSTASRVGRARAGPRRPAACGRVRTPGTTRCCGSAWRRWASGARPPTSWPRTCAGVRRCSGSRAATTTGRGRTAPTPRPGRRPRRRWPPPCARRVTAPWPDSSRPPSGTRPRSPTSATPATCVAP